MVASKKNQAKGAAELLEAGAEPKEEDCVSIMVSVLYLYIY